MSVVGGVLLLIGLILLTIGIVVLVSYSNNTVQNPAPAWAWFALIGGIILIIIGAIVWYWFRAPAVMVSQDQEMRSLIPVTNEIKKVTTTTRVTTPNTSY